MSLKNYTIHCYICQHRQTESVCGQDFLENADVQFGAQSISFRGENTLDLSYTYDLQGREKKCICALMLHACRAKQDNKTCYVNAMGEGYKWTLQSQIRRNPDGIICGLIYGYSICLDME